MLMLMLRAPATLLLMMMPLLPKQSPTPVRQPPWKVGVVVAMVVVVLLLLQMTVAQQCRRTSTPRPPAHLRSRQSP